MRKPPDWFAKRLGDIGGYNFLGQPRLRVIWAPDHRLADGVAKGRFMYPDADDPSKSLECWVLETWMPPEMFDNKDWKEEVLGPMPRQGMYGMVCPLTVYVTGTDIEAVELTESVLNSIAAKHNKDVQWASLPPTDRYQIMLNNKEREDREIQEQADKEAHDLGDYFEAHQEAINNDDNRVFSLPKHLAVDTPNNKMPVKI